MDKSIFLNNISELSSEIRNHKFSDEDIAKIISILYFAEYDKELSKEKVVNMVKEIFLK